FPAPGRSVSASRCVDRRIRRFHSVQRELSAPWRRTLRDPPCPRAPAAPEPAANVVKHLSGETIDPAPPRNSRTHDPEMAPWPAPQARRWPEDGALAQCHLACATFLNRTNRANVTKNRPHPARG